jgi:putative ubiquitin-RnfH superfamily antitoxin RatB of RatAB toxin-antitoxin module
MKVELAYAKPDEQYLVTLVLQPGATIEVAIIHSGILAIFPEIDLNRQRVGIFGKVTAITTLIKDGDRIEIYRPLIVDPKDARRARAVKKAKTK